MLLTESLLHRKFNQAVDYPTFVAMGELNHRPQWDQRYSQLALDDQQQQLVASFTRTMHILTLTGTWCGDCALQGAALQRIAQGNPQCINLRFLMRADEHADLITKCQINAGFRVPMTWIMAEDFEPVAVFGDRTLSRYRAMARSALGDDACNVLAPPPADPVRTVLGEMLDEVERAHLLLRTSPRLCEMHGD